MDDVAQHPQSPRPWFRGKYFWMLAATFLFVLVPPEAARGHIGAQVLRLALHATYNFTLILTLHAVLRRRWVFVVIATAAVLPPLANAVEIVLSGPATPVLAPKSSLLTLESDDASQVILTSRLIFEALLYLTLSSVLLADVLRPRRVTLDQIFGSICVYVLIAATWSVAYQIVLQFNEGALAGISGSPGKPGFDDEILYFSVTTLTTLGYGDITPVSAVARSLTNLEAITGQMYVAVLVARLVAVHVAHERAPNRTRSNA